MSSMGMQRDIVFGLCLVGCSSAATLPSGGPFGGTADDAGVTVGTMPGGSGSSTGSGSGASSVRTSASSAVSGSGPAPTWTYLYDRYLSSNGSAPTIGDCDSSTCHAHSECSSAEACYSWIGTGRQGPLANGGGDALFTWDGGYMPEGGPTSDPQAEADFTAWIAAGSLDN